VNEWLFAGAPHVENALLVSGCARHAEVLEEAAHQREVRRGETDVGDVANLDPVHSIVSRSPREEGRSCRGLVCDCCDARRSFTPSFKVILNYLVI